MVKYDVVSERNRTYQRTILIDGQKVEIDMDGKEGVMTSIDPLKQDAIERLERFYNINILEEGATVVEDTGEEAPTEEPTEPATEETTPEEPVTEEPATEEPTPEEPATEEPVAEEEPSMEDITMEDTPVEDPTTEEGVPTSAEEIQARYNDLGTWSAVADSYDVSTSTLRRWRDELGMA